MKNVLKNVFGLWLIATIAFAFTPALAENNNSNDHCPGGMNKTQAQSTQQMPNLNDALNQAGATDFSQILEKSGASKMLSQGGPYTIIAPSNEALSGLPQNEIDKMKDNPALVKKVLENHMMKGTITAENENSPDLMAVSGRKIEITKDDQGVHINGQKIMKGVRYQNGVIYMINGVIL